MALASADRGVALAPELGLTHAARGFVLTFGFGNFIGGFSELSRARVESPGDATIEMIYTNVAVSVGQLDEGLAAAHRAVELDPLRQDTWGCLAYILFEAKHYAAALDALEHARSVSSNLPPGFISQIGLSFFMLGKPEAARQACSSTTDWMGAYCLAFAYHALDRNKEAEAQLDAVRSALGDTGADNYAGIYAQWGRKEEALNWLRRAAELRDPGLVDVKTDPLLDPLRSLPEFQSIEQHFSAPK